MTTILAIETSCDETAAAVVEDGRLLRANVVASQTDLHKRYGGVFPEMASRQHMLTITPVVREAMAQAQVGWGDIDALGAVHGPGLAGSLLVGLNVAKALAWAHSIPLVGVNHLEAHVYANWLVPPDQDPDTFVSPSFPLVCLVVSGGHSDLILMTEHHEYTLLGRTVDDAAGEAFDKVARLLGLGYPGGPAIQRAAKGGDPTAFPFPRTLRVAPFDFSFSGLKTAVLRVVQDLQTQRGVPVDRTQKLADAGLEEGERELPLADIAASFQSALVGILVQKTAAAVERFGAVQVLIAGGVAANELLRNEMRRQVHVPVRYPPIRFCTDNAAMVGAAAYYRYLSGVRSGLDLDVIPNLVLV
ncbi:MAG: tRNA (adenosine(37)-N6)-threonylcarbamoyltransferase complex transferase subunit TsaD [Chloroflexi bacterium]|nr:tRNA (adenosine(37)-N6)-threonylcarbamoyltransferase complex transferase subunit TsaD [Chloroflexota bacterium]